MGAAGSRDRHAWHDAAKWSLWRFGRLLARALGVSAEGMELVPATGPCVVIAPHTSFVDPLVLWTSLPRPARFLTATFYLERRRLIAFVLRVAQVIPVRRSQPDPGSVRAALRLLAQGEMLAFFPEGGRTWTGVPTRPMPSATKLLAGLTVPVFLAVIEGGYDFWPRWDDRPRLRRLTVRVIGPLALSEPRASALAGKPARPARTRWWTAIFKPVPRASLPGAEHAIRTALQEAARDEPERLCLRGLRRRRALASLFGLCPECAASPLAPLSDALGCPVCQARWCFLDGGRLGQVTPEPGQPRTETVSSLFQRMVDRLEQVSHDRVTVRAQVEVATEPGRRRSEPSEATLGPTGLRFQMSHGEVHVPLAAFERAQIEGSAALEISWGHDAYVLYVHEPGAALRLLLTARAMLKLPLDTMMP